jgi:tRNA-dihydrouridine synthase
MESTGLETGLAPLSLGSVEVGFPIVQAALSGYSDWPMRLIARRHGASYTLCEVMLDQFLLQVKDRRRNRHFLYLSDDDHPVGGQLMGAQPELFAAGAQKLVQAGFDVIDINFGCPVKKVLGRCRGGYHLSRWRWRSSSGRATPLPRTFPSP